MDRGPDAMTAPEILTRPEALRALIRSALASRPTRPEPLPSGWRRAAVLLPLVHAQEGAAFLLTTRSEAVEHHKGQVSFPGGVLEPGEHPRDAALRETYEEIGVDPADVEMLGALEEEPTAVSGFLVTPFVGSVPYPYPLRPSPREVRAILRVPLRDLLDPRNFRSEIWDRGGRPFPMYFYTVGPEVIWGATARIIARFLESVFGVIPRVGRRVTEG